MDFNEWWEKTEEGRKREGRRHHAIRRRYHCTCPDPDDAKHCALLREFPGGFYGDDDAAMFDDYCECACHREDDNPPWHGWCECGCPLDDDGKCMGLPPCNSAPEAAPCE